MSGGVDEAAVTFGRACRYQLDHSSVYRLRAEASAGGENERAAVNAKFKAAVFFICGEELGAHWESRQHAGVLRLEVFFRRHAREHNSIDLLCERLVRHAGIGVLLVDSGRHAELRRHSDNWTADIAAEAYRKLGLKILDYLFRLRGRFEHL